jgi:hypothetical protein
VEDSASSAYLAKPSCRSDSLVETTRSSFSASSTVSVPPEGDETVTYVGKVVRRGLDAIGRYNRARQKKVIAAMREKQR